MMAIMSKGLFLSFIGTRMRTSLSACLALPLLASASGSAQTALGETGALKDLTVSGYATLVNDYRFRGLSLSDKDTAIQGSFNLNHSSGFYVGAWGSSIESFQGAELELDIYGGYSNTAEGLTYNVGFYGYTYPGATGSTDYLEVFASLGGRAGPTSWTVGSNYAFDQESLGDQDNIYGYLYTSTQLGSSNFSLLGNFGYEDGAFGNDKLDWLLGLSYAFAGNYSLSVSYVDTANSGTSIGEATVVANLSASF